MARYHFNIYDGVDLPDREGTELPDWHAARLEAIRLAGQVINDQAKRIALGEDWRLEVTDDKGLVLFRLDFTIYDAPVVKPIASKDADAVDPPSRAATAFATQFGGMSRYGER